MTLQETRISGGGSKGGVISANGIRDYGGVVNVVSSTISGNGNCGVEDFHPPTDSSGEYFGGHITISKSLITGNGCGVAADYSDSFLVQNTKITHNRYGGAFTYQSNLRIVNSTMSDNKGPGVSALQGSATITGSTITGNVGRSNSDEFTGTRGGGVFLDYAGFVKIENTTISGNSATNGGGIALEYGNNAAVVKNSTITHNTAMRGGGISVDAGMASVTLNKSLVAGNSALKGREVSVIPRFDTEITSGDFNIFGFAGNSGIVGFAPGTTDIVPAQPLAAILKPTLANNGGPTLTHALVAGSRAVDAINDGTCPPPATDQRGIKRPQDGNRDGGPACDVGAFEYVAPAL